MMENEDHKLSGVSTESPRPAQRCDSRPSEGSECEYRFCPRERTCFHYCHEHHESICEAKKNKTTPMVEREHFDSVCEQRHAWIAWATTMLQVSGVHSYGMSQDEQRARLSRIIVAAQTQPVSSEHMG